MYLNLDTMYNAAISNTKIETDWNHQDILTLFSWIKLFVYQPSVMFQVIDNLIASH